MRILVVDDYPPFATVIIHFLRRCGNVEDVRHAYDGLNGLRLVDEFKPSVVIVDYRMPSMDGITFTRLLKSKPNPPKVVMMSFTVDGRVQREALAAGADAYFHKDGTTELLMPLLIHTLGCSSGDDQPAGPHPGLPRG
jgi:CheY-like chemotaxis protein